MRETHGGGLASDFGDTKTLEILKEHFHWAIIKGDVQAIVVRCVACQNA